MTEINKVDVGYLRYIGMTRSASGDYVETEVSFADRSMPYGLQHLDNERCYLVKKDELDTYMARKESLEKTKGTPEWYLSNRLKQLEAENANLRDINKSLGEEHSKLVEKNEALKDKIEDELEKKLAAAKTNVTFWRDRKEEEEDYHHYWLYTFDRVVKQAAEKGIHIDVRGNDEECNAGIVVVDNVKAEDLEKQVVQMEDANQKLRQRISAADEEIEKLKNRDGIAYWRNTYYSAVEKAKAEGITIAVQGSMDLNADIANLKVVNFRAENLEKAFNGIQSERESLDIQNGSLKEVIDSLKNRVKRLEKDNDTKAKAVVEATDRGDHWKYKYDDLAEYWDNTYKDMVAVGKNVGVKISVKGDRSDINAGIVYIINETGLGLAYKLSDMKQIHDKKWSAMTEALKAKGVEVIYMGEENEKPIVDIKIPGLDELKEQCDILRKDGALKGQQCLKLTADLNALKKECGRLISELAELKSRTLDNVEIRLSCGDIVWTYCDGFVHISSGISGMISADEISTGTVPKCSSCAHYMHNPSRFAHDWCYRPLPKEGGAGYIRMLSKDEAEGPACSDFKARKE